MRELIFSCSFHSPSQRHLRQTFLGQHPHSKCNFILSNTQRCFYLQEVKHTMHKAQGHVIHTGSQVPYLDILKLIMEIRNFWQSKYIVKCVESHFGLVLCKPEKLFILGYTNKRVRTGQTILLLQYKLRHKMLYICEIMRKPSYLSQTPRWTDRII